MTRPFRATIARPAVEALEDRALPALLTLLPAPAPPRPPVGDILVRAVLGPPVSPVPAQLISHALSALVCACHMSQDQVQNTYTGKGNEELGWDDPKNWTHGVPRANHDVVIPAGMAVLVPDGNRRFTIRSLAVEGTIKYRGDEGVDLLVRQDILIGPHGKVVPATQPTIGEDAGPVILQSTCGNITVKSGGMILAARGGGRQEHREQGNGRPGAAGGQIGLSAQRGTITVEAGGLVAAGSGGQGESTDGAGKRGGNGGRGGSVFRHAARYDLADGSVQPGEGGEPGTGSGGDGAPGTAGRVIER